MENGYESSDIISQSGDLENIYQSLKTDPIEDVDLVAEFDLINKIIPLIYKEKFLVIETEVLQENSDLLNHQFIVLLSNLKKSHNYKNVSIMFIVWCDFFNLDYNKTFKLLHNKLQTIIEISTKKFVGENVYNKFLNKCKPKEYNITTLFDLIKK